MQSFDNYLKESVGTQLLNEKATFKLQGNASMIKNLTDFNDWFYRSLGDSYTSDGKYTFARYNNGPKVVLYVTNTSNYGKAGNADKYSIVIKDTHAFINAVKSIDSIVDTAMSLSDSSDAVERVSKDSVKNLSAEAFNPVMLKNFKSIGSVAGKDKITKAQARKIIASGDFDNITHDYQMRDDNHSTTGAIELTYANISSILSDLDNKYTSILRKNVDSESFSVWVHSNLSYYINRD